jgi:pyruvate,water dikinase
MKVMIPFCRIVQEGVRMEVFDRFSIGSNDLTQFVLGIDRDSGTIADPFGERNDAVVRMIG